jgi:hypothetical protein
VVSTPANLFISKGMKPGETRKFVQEVSVRYLDDIGVAAASRKLFALVTSEPECRMMRTVEGFVCARR